MVLLPDQGPIRRPRDTVMPRSRFQVLAHHVGIAVMTDQTLAQPCQLAELRPPAAVRVALPLSQPEVVLHRPTVAPQARTQSVASPSPNHAAEASLPLPPAFAPALPAAVSTAASSAASDSKSIPLTPHRGEPDFNVVAGSVFHCRLTGGSLLPPATMQAVRGARRRWGILWIGRKP